MTSLKSRKRLGCLGKSFCLSRKNCERLKLRKPQLITYARFYLATLNIYIHGFNRWLAETSPNIKCL